MIYVGRRRSFEVRDPATGECTEDLCPNPTCRLGEICDPVTGECDQNGQMCVGGDCSPATST